VGKLITLLLIVGVLLPALCFGQQYGARDTDFLALKIGRAELDNALLTRENELLKAQIDKLKKDIEVLKPKEEKPAEKEGPGK
jgi:cell division protein FtsB